MSFLKISLGVAVSLRIAEYERRGGPTDGDLERTRKFADILTAKGDILQFGGGKKGEVAEIFNGLADALAVMSFCPGGVLFGKDRWEGQNLLRRLMEGL